MAFPNSKVIKKVKAGSGKYGNKTSKDQHIPGGNEKLHGTGESDGLSLSKPSALKDGRRSSYMKNHSMRDNIQGNTIIPALH